MGCCFLLGNLLVGFLSYNESELVGLIISSGCDQMTCANPKEVFDLRIFGHSKLLVIC